ncbi:MAG TPA: paraquat-inducible protein B [Nitrospiraceae bacterium]|jgi:paraquat-inducible protein B|nr:paraquat-inducible protein B [Nitrospiraceae bacterium]
MTKKASKSLIGVFVLGALVLVVAGIVIFGSGKFFTKVHKNVIFFEGSVKGLSIGASVLFHGVQIGHVTDILLEVNKRDLTAFVPVYIEVYQQKILPIGEDHNYDERFLQDLIKKGLRAQLQLQSFVTGQLMVNLDFYPNTPVRLVGLEKRYPEIPTVPSSLEQLAKRFEELPLKEIADRLNETLAGINRLVNSRDLQASIGSLNQLLGNTDVLVKNLNSRVGPLASDIKGTADAARGAFLQAEKTLRFDEGAPGQIASGIIETLSAAEATLKETHTAVSNINGIAVQNANLGYEIGRTLEQIAELSRSIRVLADYLERHPEALLRGKSAAKGE